jgi:hypothetical protein
MAVTGADAFGVPMLISIVKRGSPALLMIQRHARCGCSVFPAGFRWFPNADGRVSSKVRMNLKREPLRSFEESHQSRHRSGRLDLNRISKAVSHKWMI